MAEADAGRRTTVFPWWATNGWARMFVGALLVVAGYIWSTSRWSTQVDAHFDMVNYRLTALERDSAQEADRLAHLEETINRTIPEATDRLERLEESVNRATPEREALKKAQQDQLDALRTFFRSFRPPRDGKR